MALKRRSAGQICETGGSLQLCLEGLNCKCRPFHEPCLQGKNCHQAAPLERIATGPYSGLPKRFRTDRSEALDPDQVALLANAHAFAGSDLVARPLTVLLTIVWRHSAQWSGCDCWSAFQTRFLDKTTRWLVRHGIGTAFVWVRETAHGSGPHTHVALHIGARPQDILPELKAWLLQAFDFQPEGVHFSYGKFGSKTPKMRAGMLLYLVKGIDHRAFRYVGFDRAFIAQELGIFDRGPQGRVGIKRSGSSQNIAPGARRARGWPEAKTSDEVADLLAGRQWPRCRPVSSQSSG
jgi:hypothetical protein